MADAPYIFVSYRRSTSASYPAHSITRDLKEQYGRSQVFVDVDAILIGEDFRERIYRELDRSDVVLVFIGPHWIKATDGRYDISNETDFVRLEIRRAFEMGIPVLPFLVDGASMPGTAELPADISKLSLINARFLPADRIGRDLPDIIADIDRVWTARRAHDNPGDAAKPERAAAASRSAAQAKRAPVRDSGADTKSEDRTPSTAGGLSGRWDWGGRDQRDDAPRAAHAPPAADLVAEREFKDALGDDHFGPEMVVVPAGSFVMGSPEDEQDREVDESPQREVAIGKAFAIGRYAITFAEYDRFATVTERVPPNDEGWGRGRRPAICVSWQDAMSYVEWLRELTGREYRLPSESEWEYAARAGTTTPYWWGREPGTNRANFDGSGSDWSGFRTAPVDAFEPNAFGLYQMCGNVWEWVADTWHTDYDQAPPDGSPWLTGSPHFRMLRGGAWFSPPSDVRSASRHHAVTSSRFGLIGFRVACTLQEP